ncbi:MAG: hypothetical protein GOU97_01175 [Nanoarchaeota archaeon]|nr:hypothetical protein [Nanoarchaeota archaeon]
MKKTARRKNASIILFLTLLAVSAYVMINQDKTSGLVTKFKSDSEFIDYLSSAPVTSYGMLGGVRAQTLEAPVAESTAMDSSVKGAAQSAEVGERYSETNVQVMGFDEPDIVKTDGKNIYYSSYSDTKIINAFPPENLSLTQEIKESGELFLKDDKLIVLSNDAVEAFNKEELNSLWKLGLNGSLVDARIHGEHLYIVTRRSVSSYNPCPIYPVGGVVVRCVDIYHPSHSMSVDSTFHVVSINLVDGSVSDVESFVGKNGQTIVYMSTQGIYVTYEKQKSIMIDFFLAKTSDLLPAEVLDRMNKINGYDISSYSKQNEIQSVLYGYYSSLGDNERATLETRVYNRMDAYMEENKRELVKTGIVKIGFSEGVLSVDAVNEIPGRLLNQFAMDFHEGYLRTATTVGLQDTANDVYVLDGGLNKVGEVKDLGLDERIYSVRFIGDRGFIVTFKQIDPFYVLDLSDPTKPEVKGELKIPGYSSYLHQLEENLILGIGKEGGNVKISVFDVTSAENPVEKHKFVLNEYWSEVLYNHHAFLIDADNKIFFLPGGRGAYFFNYADGLSLAKTLEVTSARRAVYIDTTMYVVSYDKVTAVDENTWNVVNELEIDSSPVYRTISKPIMDSAVSGEGSSASSGVSTVGDPGMLEIEIMPDDE